MQNNLESYFIVMGDFNVQDYDFYIDNYQLQLKGHHSSLHIRQIAHLLKDRFKSINFNQFNKFKNISGNTLDLFFSNIHLNVYTTIDPLVKIDPYHGSQVIEFQYSPTHDVPMTDSYIKQDYKNADISKINLFLQQYNWDSLNWSDINSSCDIFHKTLLNCININTPSKKIKSDKYPIWFSYELKQEIRSKKKHHFQSKLTYEDEEIQCFINKRTLCK